MTRTTRRGFTLIELLVVMAIIGVLVAILLPAVQSAREAARRTQCRNNLKQIALALHNYHDRDNLFPPGWIGVTNNQFDANGPSGRGWLTCCLPMLEQYAASLKFDPNVPITDPVNATLRVFNVPNARCPSDPAPDTFPVTLPTNITVDFAVGNYVGSFGSLGPPKGCVLTASDFGYFDSTPCVFHLCASGTICPGDGVFYLNSRTSIGDIRDGTTYTMMCGERRSNAKAVPLPIFSTWVGAPPAGIGPGPGGAESIARVLGTSDFPPNNPNNLFRSYSSWHSGGAFVVLCDGSVQFINDGIQPNLFQGLASIRKADDTPVFAP